VLLLTPFLWLLLPGLPAAWRRSPRWVRSAAVAGLCYAAVQLYLIRFIGGHGFYSYRTMIEPLTFLFPLLVVSYGTWTAAHRVRRAAFWGLVVLAAGFHSFGAVLDRHRVESGNPFREFSAVAVAQDAGPALTAAWVAVTLTGAWFAARRAWRRGPEQDADGHPPSADAQEVPQPRGGQVPGELPLDTGPSGRPHPG
jgi:hypothetical protein